MPDERQPLIARPQHACKIGNVDARVVVDMSQHVTGRLPYHAAGAQVIERRRGRLPAQVFHQHFVDDRLPRGRAGRRQRLHARDRCVQRIECLDAHAPRVLDELPAARVVAREDLERGVVRNLEVFLLGCHALPCALQRRQDAQAHFCGRLARERDGEDFLGMFDAAEQTQVALDQQLRLAGAGRRLHDERSADIERVAARLPVRRQQPGVIAHDESPRSGSVTRGGAHPRGFVCD